MEKKSWIHTPWKLLVVGLVLDLVSGQVMKQHVDPMLYIVLATVGTAGFIMVLWALGLWLKAGLRHVKRTSHLINGW